MFRLRFFTISIFVIFFNYSASAQDTGGIELSNYIESLRQQFIDLASKKQSQSLPLYISPIEVELTAVVVAEASGKIKFYIVDAGSSISGSSTQKLSFTVAVGDPEQPFYRTSAPDILSSKDFDDDFTAHTPDQLLRVPSIEQLRQQISDEMDESE